MWVIATTEILSTVADNNTLYYVATILNVSKVSVDPGQLDQALKDSRFDATLRMTFDSQYQLSPKYLRKFADINLTVI
jgi:hypothetical protein